MLLLLFCSLPITSGAALGKLGATLRKRGETVKDKPITNWNDVPVVIDIPMAARLLGFTVDVITRKCKKGEIPAHKVFNQWRIDKDELVQFLHKS